MNCPDCNAKPGENHKPGCDVEQCPFCGMQLISCGCVYPQLGIDTESVDFDGNLTDEQLDAWGEKLRLQGLLPWTGEWHGEAECREYGFFCRSTAGGYVQTDGKDPKDMCDQNRLVLECDWDRGQRKFVRKVSA